ncbi:hypothetical protein BEL04_10635 [Mucilaginibacter sp. PPCGB 2223]|uniref:hypothetical protein n=1 Tax=Mucilaginibacter sp. PPCGB 2223 TaxID=1886027 RepID=UPI000826B63E|nr:hypothetical protein [Mucilaginibacter sp. PPCGB 2223]OCX54673.1 hypothetical protein BEL04_10635 [Mucilaginibacter sp. PPCGB 2223]
MKLAETIKPNIENLLCPDHDIHPIVDTLGDELQINCCCSKFHRLCRKQVEVILREMDFTLNNLTIV